VVVPPGHQRLPGRRAQRGHVELAVAQPPVAEPVRGRHLARAAVGTGGAEAHVVDQHDHHVGRTSRRSHRPDRVVAPGARTRRAAGGDGGAQPGVGGGGAYVERQHAAVEGQIGHRVIGPQRQDASGPRHAEGYDRRAVPADRVDTDLLVGAP
jgi:hypothetical protein